MTHRRVFRYRAPVCDAPHVVQATPGPVLAVEATSDGRDLDFWIENDPFGIPIERTFCVVGTGHPLPDRAQHCGTANRTFNGLVWHLYELPPNWRE